MESVVVVGGGLAGCEAAWQIARRGGRAVLYEMKPSVFSPAHHSPDLAEIVCSNSFKSEAVDNAHGLLKAEMDELDSLILTVARGVRVPAGGALAVDRERFSRRVTEILSAESGVEIVRQEVTAFPPEGTGIIATGPLTSDALSRSVAEGAGSRGLFFYDAIAPIVTGESIDFGKAFRASRYGKGGDDYVNCPMTEEVYRKFVAALVGAERVAVRDFERRYLFEGCLPVEEMADRGPDTLAFGPLKPVGLISPETGRQPHAVVQLRQENKEGTLYNLVGFQTRLRQGEQTRVFRMIPGLENAEFVRWGAIHRNTFIDSPRLLTETLQLRAEPRLFFAGQITGVEGYMESTAMGLLAGINGLRWTRKEPLLVPPAATLMGGLLRYVSGSAVVPFQPMNANFGLLPPLEGKFRGKERKGLLSRRALDALGRWKGENGL